MKVYKGKHKIQVKNQVGELILLADENKQIIYTK